MTGWTYSAPGTGKYRYSFNGKEKDDETYGGGNCIAYEARIYDSRLGRMFSTDPREMEYAWLSTYSYYANCPITIEDYLGEGDKVQKGEGAAAYAKRNNVSLDKLANLNSTIFKDFPKDGTEEEKQNYWKDNSGKNWKIHPGQELNTGETTTSAKGGISASPKTNSNSTKPSSASATVATQNSEKNEKMDYVGLGFALVGAHLEMKEISYWNLENRTWKGKDGKIRSMRVNGNGATGGKFKYGQNISKGFSFTGKVLGVYGAYTSYSDYKEGKTSDVRFISDQASNAYSTFGGIYGAAFGIGWETGRLITSLPGYNENVRLPIQRTLGIVPPAPKCQVCPYLNH